MTKGIDLNNPGDLEFNERDKWQGLDNPPREGRWFKFKTAVDGIRAVARILITFQDKYGLNTIEQWITKYAPPSENDTAAYIKAVCEETGLVATYPLDAHDYRFQRAVVPAIIRHEQGSQPYSAAQIDEALRRAGVVKPVAETNTKSAATSPLVITGGLGVTMTAVQQAVGAISPVWDKINSFGIDPRYVMGAAGLCAAIVGAYLIIDWIRKRQQGLA